MRCVKLWREPQHRAVGGLLPLGGAGDGVGLSCHPLHHSGGGTYRPTVRPVGPCWSFSASVLLSGFCVTSKRIIFFLGEVVTEPRRFGFSSVLVTRNWWMRRPAPDGAHEPGSRSATGGPLRSKSDAAR